jgi:hypothetical protein
VTTERTVTFATVRQDMRVYIANWTLPCAIQVIILIKYLVWNGSNTCENDGWR